VDGVEGHDRVEELVGRIEGTEGRPWERSDLQEFVVIYLLF